MIPDTDFIMQALVSSEESGHHGGLDSTHHLIKASHTSQAGAKASRYIKIVRVLTFIKIIRLSKLLEKAKEIKQASQNIDLTSLTLADIVMSKRRGHQHLLNDQKANKRKERKSLALNKNIKKILINSIIGSNKTNDNKDIMKKENSFTGIPETENRRFINPTKLKLIKQTKSKIKVPFIDPNLDHDDEFLKFEKPGNFNNSSSQDLNSKILLLNNCNLTLFNVTNNINNQILINPEYFLNQNKKFSEDADHIEKIDSLSSNREEFNERDAPCVEYEIKLEELDLDDLNFINKDIKSENGDRKYKNPLKTELEIFLKINAIELEDLFDKHVVLIGEKNFNNKKRRSTFCKGINHFLNKIEQIGEVKAEISQSAMDSKSSERSQSSHSFSQEEKSKISKHSSFNCSNQDDTDFRNLKIKDKKISEIFGKNSDRQILQNLCPMTSEFSNKQLKLLDDDQEEQKLIKNPIQNGGGNFSVVMEHVALEDKQIQKLHQSSKISKRRKTVELNPDRIKEAIKPSIQNNIPNKPECTETVEDKLTSSLANKLVLVIMMILVIVPVLDQDYIDEIRFTADEIPSLFRYCLEGLDLSFVESIKDLRYLKTLNLIYKNCIDLTENGLHFSEIENKDNLTNIKPFFYNINFTEYPLYQTLYKIAENNESLRLLIPEIVYQHPNWEMIKNSGRENYNFVTKIYYPDESDSKISLIYNNSTEGKLSACLNILKILFIAIILLSGVYFFSNDIQVNVTLHLDKITTRIRNYLDNTDSLSENVQENPSEFNDIRSAYQNALLVLEEKQGSTKSRKDDEIYVIDQNIKIIINLISISIGKPILSLISKTEVNGYMNLDLNQQGVKTNAVFLMMSIDNTEKLLAKYQTKAIHILSKVYSVFHCQGIIHHGDIFTGKNMIVWKEDRDNAVTRFRLYVYKLLQERNKSKVKKKRGEDNQNMGENTQKNPEGKIDSSLNYKFEFSRENIHNMGYFCANKVLYQLFYYLPKTMKILQEMDVRINLFLNYGELINGYMGHNKLDEIYTCNEIIESQRILKVLNKKNLKPAVFLHQNFKDNLSYKLEELIYPCEVVKVFSRESQNYKIFSIYKIYANPHLLNNRDQDMPINLSKEDTLEERRVKLISLGKFNGKVDDWILSDQIIETYLKMNINNDLRNNIISFFECIRNSKLDESVVLYRRITKDSKYAKFRDQDFKNSFSNFYKKIRGKLINKSVYSNNQIFSFNVDVS